MTLLFFFFFFFAFSFLPPFSLGSSCVTTAMDTELDSTVENAVSHHSRPNIPHTPGITFRRMLEEEYRKPVTGVWITRFLIIRYERCGTCRTGKVHTCRCCVHPTQSHYQALPKLNLENEYKNQGSI